MEKLNNEDIKNQLAKVKPGDRIPAIYEGETYRSSYIRQRQHFDLYNSKKEKQRNKSFMWIHTEQHHEGKIGENRGQNDYKVTVTDHFRSNLQRQIQEGVRQTRNESFQRKDKVRVLNSKIDFNKPLRTKLTVIKKANGGHKVTDMFSSQNPIQAPTLAQAVPDRPSDPRTQAATQAKDKPDRLDVGLNRTKAKLCSTQVEKQTQAGVKLIQNKFPHRQPRRGKRQLTDAIIQPSTQVDSSDLSFSPQWSSTPEKLSRDIQKVKKLVTFSTNDLSL